jgi:hypothetical protein
MKFKLAALTILNLLAFFVIFCWFAKPISAVEYQSCTVSSSCTIGEFLFDDSYTPDATASCTLVSRYPNGNAFLSPPVAMTASSSGWYSYTTTLGTTEGIYPSQICCTTYSGEYLCLDKTFKVVPLSSSGGATAAEVWSYENRSLTSFGTLVADIWNYSTRSLSTFGSLITDIWSRDSRTLTSTDSASVVASLAEIKEIKKVVQENRIVLEQLINKPIVKTFIDENPIPNLTEKLEKTKTSASNLYSATQNLKSRGQLLSKKWTTLTEAEIKSELTTLSAIFKQDVNQKDSNIIATTDWLKTSWNSSILLNLSDQAQAAQSQLGNLLNDTLLYGKGNNADAFSPALSHIQKLDELVGTSLATSTDLNLYGFIKKTTETVAYFDKQSSEGLRLLTEIKKDVTKDQSAAIETYSNTVYALNQLPQVDTFLIKSTKSNTPSNKVLGLMAIVDTNRLLLAANTGQIVKNIWLEEGSIIFRAVATNPSRSLTQKVAIKYYLPTEIKKEQIIRFDQELVIDFDPIENALFASGEITLAPNATRTLQVEVEDIWSFKQEELDSLKAQINELIAVLDKTSYYAQAVAIKSDIFVALDKIMLRQAQAVTPENRIRTYRESALDMNGIEQKIISLKELAVRSSSTGGFFGSIGGVQNISIWGIVLIIIAGFAFITVYVNALRADSRSKREREKNETVTGTLKEEDGVYHPTSKHRHRETPRRIGHRVARIASIVLLVSGVGSVGASISIKAAQDRPVALVSPSPDAVVLGTTSDNSFPIETHLKLPDSGKVPVRSAPAITASEIMSLMGVDKIYVFRLIDGWAQIGLSDKDSDQDWWVNQQYLDLK